MATGAWINGGFFVLSPKVIDFIEGDQTIWEKRTFRATNSKRRTAGLVSQRFLAAYGYDA